MRASSFSQIINLLILLLLLLAGLFLFPILETNYDSFYQFVPFLKSEEVAKQAVISPLPVSEPIETNLQLLFFGDLMLDRNVKAILVKKNLDFLLSGLASSTDFSKFDLVGANLEGAVTNNGEHYAPDMGFDFAFVPSTVAELKKYNFSYFTLANNHFSDQGERGIKETRENLKNLGFNYSGEADAQISENSLSLLDIKDKRLALISFSMVYHNFDLEAAKKIISDIRSQVDWVIISIHWGNEYQHNFSAWQQKIGRELVDSGADIIIGHHPHVVQGMEIYQNRPIFYSLGNFIFDQYFSAETQEGLSLELGLVKNQITITLKPLSSQRSQVLPMAENKKNIFLDNFATWSKADEGLKKQIQAQIINIAK